MAVSAVGEASSSTSNSVPTNGIGQEDFLKILLTQLSYQDPLKPMDNQEFIAQMAQFTTLEQTKQLNDRLDSLLSIQSSDQSIGLIGKTVEINTSGGAAVGSVAVVSFSNGSPELTIKLANGEYLTGINPSQISVVR